MRHMTLLSFIFFVLILFPANSHSTPYSVKEISLLEIDSAITPATYDYLKYQFQNIPDGALILIKMNTPGGLISTTKDIITLIGTQEKPVAVWITPEGASAASAGAIIASSAHFILMSSGTNMGAATPVGLGNDIKEKDGRAKAMNDLMALVRSMSHLRNRPAAPFEEMIGSAKSFTDLEAKNLKIIDGIVTDFKSLKKILNSKSFIIQGKNLEIEFPEEVPSKIYGPTLGQKLLSVLANPSTAYFLFLMGIALLYFEFQAPGGYYAGGFGIISIILSAIAFQVLPLNWGSFALLLTGVVLLILEIHITSYGLLGLGGLVAFIMGSLFLFHGEGGFISVDYAMLISTILGVVAGVGIVIWYMIRERKKNPKNEHFFLPLESIGIILARIEHTENLYQIKVKGEIWKAKSISPLELGDSVRVTSIDREKLLANIKKVDKE
jgi:membrane-bound serine protease (ClpP class)